MEEKLVTIRLPLTREEREDVFVGINGHNWLIKRGEQVKVPQSADWGGEGPLSHS